MGLDTKVTYADPDVEITVEDDGGGDKKYKVELLVCWDPKLLKTEGKVVPDARHVLYKTHGMCLWYGYDVPEAGKDFYIDLQSKGNGDATVYAVAVDKFKGQIKKAEYVIANRGKAKKKAKKKA